MKTMMVALDDLQERGGLYYAAAENKPFTGRAFFMYENGQKQSEAEFKDGEKHGTRTWWHENGSLAYTERA